MKRDKKEDMNKKSTSEATRVKSKKLKLNKQTQRDLTLPDRKSDVVKGGVLASGGHCSAYQC